jgi:hypothetical protein
VSSLLVIVESGLKASSRFSDISCESPPPNRPVNILIFQVPEEILICCKGGKSHQDIDFDPDGLWYTFKVLSHRERR